MSMVDLPSQPLQLRLDTVEGRISAVLSARRLTVSEAARQSDVSRTTLTCWANGSTRPTRKRLGGLAKLTDVSLDWLLARSGPDPDIVSPNRKGGRLGDGDSAELIIPEISGSMAAHAERLDLTPQAGWMIPTTVVQLGFNSEPGNLAVQRVVSTDKLVERGDYLLIDHSRNKFDDAGAYIVTRDNDEAAFRIELEWTDGTLTLRNMVMEDWRSLKVLGRVMGFLRPA